MSQEIYYLKRDIHLLKEQFNDLGFVKNKDLSSLVQKSYGSLIVYVSLTNSVNVAHKQEGYISKLSIWYYNSNGSKNEDKPAEISNVLNDTDISIKIL